jgi:hypothetical protein
MQRSKDRLPILLEKYTRQIYFLWNTVCKVIQRLGFFVLPCLLSFQVEFIWEWMEDHI